MLINLCILVLPMCLQTTFDFIFCQLQMTQINGILQATCFQTFYCISLRHFCYMPYGMSVILQKIILYHKEKKT